MGKPGKAAESGILKDTPIRRIRALDVSKQTFKCCTLTAEKNFEDRTVTSGRIHEGGRHHNPGRRHINLQFRA